MHKLYSPIPQTVPPRQLVKGYTKLSLTDYNQYWRITNCSYVLYQWCQTRMYYPEPRKIFSFDIQKHSKSESRTPSFLSIDIQQNAETWDVTTTTWSTRLLSWPKYTQIIQRRQITDWLIYIQNIPPEELQETIFKRIKCPFVHVPSD